MNLQLCTTALNHYSESGFASDNKLLFLAGDINDRVVFDSDKDKYSWSPQKNEMNVSLSRKIQMWKNSAVWEINQESHTAASLERQKLKKTHVRTQTHADTHGQTQSMCELAQAPNTN